MLIELAGQESTKTLERLVTTRVQRRLLRLDTPAGLAQLEAALVRHPLLIRRSRSRSATGIALR